MTDRPTEGSAKNTRLGIVTRVAVSVPQRQTSSSSPGSGERTRPNGRTVSTQHGFGRQEAGRPASSVNSAEYGHGTELAKSPSRSSDEPIKQELTAFATPQIGRGPQKDHHGISLPVPLSVGGYVLQLRLDPIVYGVVHHGLAQRSCPSFALLVWHREGGVDGLGLLVYVVGVDGEGVLSELFVGAGVLGEDQDTVLLVDNCRLLGDEVHPVADGVD